MNRNVRTQRNAGFRAQIRQALQELPQKERLVATLYFVGELTEEEIAHELGWARSCVRSARKDALAKIQNHLLKQGFHTEALKLTDNLISEVVSNPVDVPEGTFERILMRIINFIPFEAKPCLNESADVSLSDDYYHFYN